jgi:3-oxoacyl-[acyl-carrier-protein] synthase III
MGQTSGTRLTAIGSYVPDRVITNADLSRLVDTNDEWIVRRTGIRERRAAGELEFTSDLCVAAARDLAARSKTSLDDVDFVILGTTTPDYAFPSVASQVQNRLGIARAGAIDINATCAGFMYGLHMAHGLVSAGVNRKVLVLSGETLTKVTDYTDRATCILFGDGAGAALVEPSPQPAVRASLAGSDGSGGPLLYRTGLSDRIGAPGVAKPGLIWQNGREVYRWAVETVSNSVCELLRRSGVAADAVDWFVPHSANLRITEAVCERTGIPFERTLSSIEHFGNTSAATIPLALTLALDAGKVRDGQTILLYGFGGGLVHAGMLLQWRLGGS